MTADSSDAGNPQSPDGGRDADGSRQRERKHLPVWQETLLLLVLALGLAVVIKAVLLQAFYIPSESMEPGLIRNDRILVQKVSYWFGGEPERGDVVVFEDPGGWLSTADTPGPTGLAKGLSYVGLYPTGGHLVKRVIGTPGDVIECCDGQGRLKVNGEPIDESDYLTTTQDQCNAPVDGSITERGTDFHRRCDWTITVAPGKLFVLGDNRQHSADSRAHLCAVNADPCTESPWVDQDRVVGKVFALVWPTDRWSWVSRPAPFADVPDGAPAAQ
ncbi:signal peptidase I [Nocardioides panacisoli]|uniref:signal peptidase I n=1 Tax=Nocardioides panacisoli TaxID=627624 RepID=UPI001C634CCF|nr:signal peptidase I [Nocardioides panacisoli]QYJ04580.1 signal peptidase I [Nocardioides panacisoli]